MKNAKNIFCQPINHISPRHLTGMINARTTDRGVSQKAMKILVVISSILFCLCVNGQNRSTKANKAKTLADSIYIPIDLNDCLKQLDNIFPDSIKTKIK